MSESSPKYQRRYQSGAVGCQYARIRRLIQSWRPDEECGERDRDDQKRGDNHIAPGEVRPKWLATLLEQLFVFGAVRCRVHWLACNRRLGDSVPKNEPEMQPDKGKHDSRQNENMDGEEATKRRAADSITTKDEARHPVADNRNTPRLLRRDHHRPCRG